MQTAIPRMITVEDFAAAAGVPLHQGYDLARAMPAGVKVKLGRRVRLLEEPLRVWLAAGGHLSQK